MLIRTGCHSIKYSHDAEAMIEALRVYREFAHISAAQMDAFLSAELHYLTNDYRYFEDWNDYQPVGAYGYAAYTFEKKPAHVVVSLYHYERTERAVLEQFGFSCLVCAAVNPYQHRPFVYSRNIETIVLRRQVVNAAAMICDDCAQAIAEITSSWQGVKPFRTVDAMIARVIANSAYAGDGQDDQQNQPDQAGFPPAWRGPLTQHYVDSSRTESNG